MFRIEVYNLDWKYKYKFLCYVRLLVLIAVASILFAVIINTIIALTFMHFG